METKLGGYHGVFNTLWRVFLIWDLRFRTVRQFDCGMKKKPYIYPMKSWRLPIFFLVLCCRTVHLSAQEVLVNGSFQHTLLGNQVQIFEDKSKKMSFEEVLEQPFVHHTKSSINIGFTNSYYWLRFHLKNQDTLETKVFLEISNPHINKMQLYSVNGTAATKSILTGDNFPFSQRPYIHPHLVFPITLSPKESTEYYLWVDKHGEQLQIPIALWGNEAFAQYSSKLLIFISMMLGISSLYLLISLLFLLYFREKLTFYYWLYTWAVWVYLVAHSGFGFQYIWQNAIWWTSSARPISSLLFNFFAILFTRTFFNIQKKNRFLYPLTNTLLVLLFINFIAFFSQNPLLGLFKNNWYNPQYYEGSSLMFFMRLTYFVVLAVLWSIIGMGIYFYRKTKKNENLWFTLGFSMIMVSGTLTIFIFMGYIPDNYFTQNFPLVSHPLEIIIISFLIANRYKNIHVENANIAAELAEQRQQNAIQLLTGQAIERQRLSQELHDGISLALANIRLRLSIFSEKFQSKEVNHIVDELGDVGQDVRRFSHALSPIMLEKHGLIEAIEELIDTTKNAHPTLIIQFSHNSISERSLGSLLKQTIYQITLELINNTVKHANAKLLEVKLNEKEGFVLLELLDDGIGYDSEQESTGIGLQNIQARTQSLNGQFQIEKGAIGMKHKVKIPVI